MIRDIDDRFGRMGLSKSPFLSYDPENPEFLKVFVDRTKELYKINFALEYFKNNANRNIAIVGPSRIGKTTLLLYTQMSIRDQFRCLYFEYPLRFNELCQKGLEFFQPGLETSIENMSSRERADLFIERSHSLAGVSVLILDNFEDMLNIPEDEIEGFIRLFRRAKCLFIIACTENEWTRLMTRHQKLKYAFADEINIQQFSTKNCMEFFEARISLARKGNATGIQPFTGDAVRIIGIYSFFIPGRLSDLANKVLFEALTEDVNPITPEYVRALIDSSPVLGSWLAGLHDNERHTIEIMIEQNKPVSFEDLADTLGVSRVAAAGYIQKLIERNIVYQMDTPGKKRLFQITNEFKAAFV